MRFPQPSNEDEFELFCLRLLTIQWKREHLQPHGKRGERQHGIDIIDLVTDKPRRFAQCKHLESHKKLAAKTVREEVEKVLSSGYAIEEYWILSTGSRHSATQRAVIEINEAHAATRQFQVVVWTKDEIDAFLLALPPDVREYVIFGQIRELRSDSKSLVGLGTTIAEIRSGEFATDSATSATIARIQDLIAQHNPARAKIILEELLASLDRQRLPEADLYSLEVARFGIAMHEGDFVAAGSILYDAHQLLSTPTERSRVNQAIGLELQGKIEASNKVSSELLLEFPSSTRLLASWLRTLPDGFDLKACMERESAISTPDGDVTLALSNLAMRTSQYETAIDLAKKAVDLDPQSPQAWNVLGMSQHGLAGRQRGLGRTADLAVAKESYTKALKLARVQHLKGLAVQICLNLERVRRFLGDSPNEDLKEAIADGLSDEEMLTTVAEFFLEIGDVAEVLQVLSHARHPRSPKSRYVEGCALRKKLENADPDTSTLECFREALSDPNSPHYFPSIVFFIETAVRLKRFDQVNVALDKTVFADRHPILARLLRAWAIHVEGRHVEATALFDSCEVDLKLVDDKEELSVAGQVFGVVGRQEAALLCMERAWHHGEFDHVARALLDHAQRLKRHDIVIRVCSALREAGVSNDRLWKIEVTALQLYDPGAALKLARRWVTDYPNDKLAAFWVSILTHRLDRSAELTPDPSSWPPLEELSLVGAKCALGILLASKQPDVALNFAYQLLAQRFDEPEAHLTYTTTFLEAERIGSQGLFECSSASSNTAVYLEEAGRGVRVVVIGNEEPQEELDEVAANAPIARLLNDKRTGDVVIFDPQGLQPRKAVVREVTHKYVHRFRDCLETFQLRFPDRPAIQRINVGSEDSLDLEPIRRALELQRTGIAALERAYRETAIPVSAFAKIARRSELSTWRHLTTVDNLGVRVNLEGSNGRGVAERVLTENPRLVLDMTALLTLGHLELISKLRDWGYVVVVPTTLIDKLREFVDDAVASSRSPAISMLDDRGQLTFVPTTYQQHEAEIAFRRQLLSETETFCQVVATTTTASVSPSDRQTLSETVQRHNLDTMVQASEDGAALWTDDAILAMLARTEFNARRVWTQLVLRSALERGLLTTNDYHLLISRMWSWRFVGIDISIDTAVAAAESCDFDHDRAPLSKILDQVCSPLDHSAIWRAMRVTLVKRAWLRQGLLESKRKFFGGVFSRLKSQQTIQLLIDDLKRVPGGDIAGISEEIALERDIWNDGCFVLYP